MKRTYLRVTKDSELKFFVCCNDINDRGLATIRDYVAKLGGESEVYDKEPWKSISVTELYLTDKL